MLKRVVAAVGLLGLVAGTALAAPADYKVEARGKPKGTGSDLIVKVMNVPTGKYVTDAKVWHFSTKQAQKGPAQTVVRQLPADGKGNYRLRIKLRAQTGDSFEHFMVSVPGEAEPIHARIPVQYSDK